MTNEDLNYNWGYLTLKNMFISEKQKHDATRRKLGADISRLEMQLKEALQKSDDAPAEISRLEIAAMAMQGMLSVGGWDASILVGVALQYTDELIARAKEAK